MSLIWIHEGIFVEFRPHIAHRPCQWTRNNIYCSFHPRITVRDLAWLRLFLFLQDEMKFLIIDDIIFSGCGTGSFGGSLLIGVYGIRITFRILGVTSFVTGLLYFLLNIFYLRQKNDAKLKSSYKVDQNCNNTVVDKCWTVRSIVTSKALSSR